MTNCEIIRDLLPLYADDICSDETRRLIDEHTRECPECAKALEVLKSREIEDDLREEKNEVIQYQAKRFRRRSEAVGAAIAGLFMIPILICLIVNLASGAAMGWFFVVLAALGVAASLIVVPLVIPENRLFWTFCAFCVTLIGLLAVCCVYTHGDWFFTASSAALFGLSVVFLPFAIRAKPVRKWIGNSSRALLVLAVDLILFANMMNMISLHTKSLFTTGRIALFCALGFGLIGMYVKAKRSDEK